jgi:WD40 repeat protein
LASGSWDRSIHVWSSATGALLRAIPNAHEVEVSSVHFSPIDSRRLTSAEYHRLTAKQWDVVSGEMVGTVEGRGFAQFSPDGQTIATAGSDPTSDVLLADTETGAVRLRLVEHAFKVHTAWWSVDGSKLASASQDGACKVWDSSTGALLRTLDIGGCICSVSWGRDWVLEKQRAVALLMGHHPRLGAGSQVLGLDEELLRMILDRV